ncbi:lipopolysaccharide biosynthesis protein [Aquimarina sp. TRL1]|uniref:lipopolysaccharide biosynthesis protein n=1 Tax=Aquimarina sp. (strain TRL1) TaxID=2736252 RepID=UPI00158C063C|nr:lipopolysaccharide biosynthesis protein [Aquimarina sp. TRL1]QKX03916.1 lipopolysaccharide biosynthesis protein [Aquimarina sp. TRL1]
MSTLTQKTKDGLVWSSVDKFTTLLIQFGLGVVLARILMPKDYGLIGMIAIFMAVSQSLVDSGFYTALVQKKEVNKRDYSTILYFNLLISGILYSILFFSSKLIANFYGEPVLEKLIKVIGVSIVIISTTIVHKAMLTTQVNFKTQAVVNIAAIIVSGIVGIFLALTGYGVWALVYQYVTRTLVTSVMYWSMNRWKPLLIFDKKAFRSMFGFGGNLMLSELVKIFFKNCYLIIIGKVYKAEELGYFTRATLFKQIPATLVASILQNVTFPIMVKVIEEQDKVKLLMVRSIRLTGFLLAPVIVILLFCAEPLIKTLLTEKWLPTVVLLQILSLEIVFHPMQYINLNFLNAKGRSDLFLRLELIKNLLTVIAIVLTYRLGLIPMTIGYVGVSFVGFFINTYYTRKYINYPALEQLKDLAPYIMTSVGIGALTFLICRGLPSGLIQLVVGVIMNLGFYIVLAYVFKFRELTEIQEILMKKLKSK